MESTAFNWCQLHNAAGNPLHSIGIHCSMLHGFHCMQPGYIAPRCMQSTAFTQDVFHNAAWNPVHSIIPHVIQCINQVQLVHGAWNPLHSIRIQWAKLHAIHCIHRDAFHNAAWNPVHSIMQHDIQYIQSGSIRPSCMETIDFNRDPLGHTAWTPLHSLGIHFTTLH